MKAILRTLAGGLLVCSWLTSSAWAAEDCLRLDNFWSDGPVSVFLYEAPHGGLEPEGSYARYNLAAGQVMEITMDGREIVWVDVRVMHADGQRWQLGARTCGYRGALAMRPGETLEVSYEGHAGYADSGAGLRCRVLDNGAPGR